MSTGELPHDAKDVRPEDPQILAAAAPVLFAAPSQLKHFADGPLPQQGSHNIQDGRVMRDVGDSQFEMPHVQFTDNLVTLFECAAERFLHVDVAACLGRCDQHVVMLIDPPRTDGGNLKLFAGEHVVVVGIRPEGTGSFAGRVPSRLVFVGNRHDLDVWQLLEGEIDVVTVISFAGPTDEAHAVRPGHEVCSAE
jgi:hypothetical protein